MKNKTLFWFGTDFTDFSMSYYLKDMYDSEFYSIVDITNKPKKFFQEQKLVPFKKTWYFHDHIKSDKKPDLEYLADFEKKYNINLWKLAINERLFYKYFNFHKFTDDEILSIDEHACKLFESVLDEVKPDFVILKEPVLHHLMIFYELCRARGIKILMLSMPKIGFRCMIGEQTNKLSIEKSLDEIQIKNRSIDELKEFLNQHSSKKQIQNFDVKKSVLKEINLIKKFGNNNSYLDYGKTKKKLFVEMLKSTFKEKYRHSFINKNLIKTVDYNCKFVYFPLGVDDGKEILISAPFFTNQIEIIRHIAKSLPVGYRLYVKEHPSSIIHDWRKVSEYKEIIKIPNVTLIHPQIESKKIYENCSLVFSVSGSAGFEAAFYQTPSIVFSDWIFNILPSVFRIKNMEDLPSIIQNSLQTEVITKDLDQYLIYIENNTFKFDWFGLLVDIRKEFYFNKVPFDIEILDEKMKKFLDKNQERLKILAKEFLKKM